MGFNRFFHGAKTAGIISPDMLSIMTAMEIRRREIFWTATFIMLVLSACGREMPHKVNTLSARGDYLLEQDDPVEAEKCFEEALKITQENTVIQGKYGYTLGINGKYGAALENLKEASFFNLENVDMMARLGNFYFQRGELEKAFSLWNEGLALDPDHYAIRNHIEKSLFFHEDAASFLEQEAGEVQSFTPEIDLTDRKFLLIGLEGGDWSAVFPLVGQEKAPCFSEIINDGASGYLWSGYPIFSGAVWTGIATGRRSRDHGIIREYVKAWDSMEARETTRLLRKTEAIWTIFTTYKLSSAALNYPKSYPAERIKGLTATGLGEEGKDGLTYPDRLNAELIYYEERAREDAQQFGEMMMRMNIIEEEEAGKRDRGAFFSEDKMFENLYEDFAECKAGLYIFKKYDPDLILLYFKGLENVARLYSQGVKEGREFDYERFRKGDFLMLYYQLIDGFIGKFSELSREDREIFIVSNHGIGGGKQEKKVFFLNRLFEQLGYLEFEKGEDEEKSGKPDISRTKLYAVKNDVKGTCSHLYVNRQGMSDDEPASDEKIEDFIFQVIQELRNLTDEGGFPVFTGAVKTTSEEQGHATYPVPDICVNISDEIDESDHIVWEDEKAPCSYWIKTVEQDWIHTLDGMLAVKGPSIGKKIHLQGASILDVTPTILCLKGIPLEIGISGRPVKKLVSSAVDGVRYVDAYENSN